MRWHATLDCFKLHTPAPEPCVLSLPHASVPRALQGSEGSKDRQLEAAAGELEAAAGERDGLRRANAALQGQNEELAVSKDTRWLRCPPGCA